MLTYTKGNNQLIEIKQRYMLIQESEDTVKKSDDDDNQENEPAFKDRSSADHLVHGTKQLSSAIPTGITFSTIFTAVSILFGSVFSVVKINLVSLLIDEAIRTGDWNAVIKGYSEVGITVIELVAILSILGIPLISIGPLITSLKVIDGANSLLAGLTTAALPKGWGANISKAMDTLNTISINIAAGVPLSVIFGIGQAVSGVAIGASEVARGVTYGIANTVTGKPIEGIKSIGKGVYDGTKDIGSGIYNGARSVGSGVYNGAKELGSGIYNGIKTVGNSIANIGK